LAIILTTKSKQNQLSDLIKYKWDTPKKTTKRSSDNICDIRNKKWQEEELVEHFEVQIEEASGNKKHLKNSMTSKVIMITRTMSQKMK